MSDRNVNVGLVQMSCTADTDENLKKAIQKIRTAAGNGAQIVCLQELFRSLYFCDVEFVFSIYHLYKPCGDHTACVAAAW